MKLIIVGIFISLSMNAFSCAGIVMRPELNALIKLEKLEQKNKYRVTAPTRIEKLPDSAVIYLVYSTDESQGLHIDDEYMELKSSDIGGKTSVEFYVAKMVAKPFILVDWSTETSGVCNGVGITRFIEAE